MRRRSFIFHPLVVLCCSLLGAALYAAYVTLRHPAEARGWQYVYVVPIVVPFVAFLFDRAEAFPGDGRLRLALDALVTGTAMLRAVGHVPYVSGHALFLTYCALTARSRVARLTAAAVMLQVIYLKYVVWHDWVSSTGGIVLGVAGAFIWRRRASLSCRLRFTPSKTMNHHTPLTFTGRVRSFRCALAGIRVMVSSQHNAWIHALATALVITVGLHFGLGRAEWCWVILAVVAVWTAEALNTAFEFLTDVASPAFHPLAAKAKDVAAGAVLITALGAVAIGVMVFGPYVAARVGGWR